MKKCFKCDRVQPLSEFYKHAQMGDGHLNKCKTCTRRDVQENYATRRPHYLAYERQRYGPKKIATLRASNQRHPEHVRARKALEGAVKRGKVTRLPCEVCGETKTEGHHEDYSKPLIVRWLCKKHHGEVHRVDAAAARPF